THDEPFFMAPDDKHDLISGTCSHLPQDTHLSEPAITGWLYLLSHLFQSSTPYRASNIYPTGRMVRDSSKKAGVLI
ncbi:hypothetical protein, partial [Aeromonas caviae]